MTKKYNLEKIQIDETLNEYQRKLQGEKALLEWYKNRLPLWKKNPVLFAREVCGWNPVGEQVELLMSLVDDDKVAVKAGRAVGKSVVAAIAALWFITVHYNSLVLITSPNFQQLTDVIFGTIREIHRTSPLLMLMFESTATQFRHRLMPATWQMVIKTATKGEGIRGYNRPNKLYITDETTGIAEEILDALMGSTDEANSKFLMISNPTRRSGRFYDIFTTPAAYPEWKRVTISRLITGYKIIALTSIEAAEKAKARWENSINFYGEEHPDVRIEILGEFPLQDNKMAFPMELIEFVSKKDPFEGVNKKDVESIVLGVDVAGMGGDLIVFTQNKLNYNYNNTRERTHVEPKEHFSIYDAYSRANYNITRDKLIAASEAIVTEYTSNPNNKFKMLYLNIDATGVGQAFFDYVKQEVERSTKLINGHQFGKWVRCIDIKFQEKAEDYENYVNRRAEMGEQFRHKLEKNKEYVEQSKDPIIYMDLSDIRMMRGINREMSNIQKEYDNKHRVKYESKDKIRKRLKGVSTDTLDSLLLASYMKKPRGMWFI